MGVESAADRMGYLIADAFGEPVTWTPAATSVAAPISAIFEHGALIDNGFGQGPGAMSAEATLTMREADLPASWAVGDPVTMNATD